MRLPNDVSFLPEFDNSTLKRFCSFLVLWQLNNNNNNNLLLVFSVTPFKIDSNKNQNHSTDKVQNLGNERR